MNTRDTLEHGLRFPYDASDAWWDGDGSSPPPPIDWAHAAARGVIADLLDRRTIKWSLEEIDEDVRQEIVSTIADIVREAAAQKG